MMFLRLGGNARTALSSQEMVGFGRKTHLLTGVHFACSFPQPSLAMQESLISCPLASLTMAMPGSEDVFLSLSETKCTEKRPGSSDSKLMEVTV